MELTRSAPNIVKVDDIEMCHSTGAEERLLLCLKSCISKTPGENLWSPKCTMQNNCGKSFDRQTQQTKLYSVCVKYTVRAVLVLHLGRIKKIKISFIIYTMWILSGQMSLPLRWHDWHFIACRVRSDDEWTSLKPGDEMNLSEESKRLWHDINCRLMP